MTRRTIIFAMAGIAVAALATGAAYSQAAAGQERPEPSNAFNYAIKRQARAHADHRITNPDGSWREETRQGNCVTIKEGTADGAVKTTRKCD